MHVIIAGSRSAGFLFHDIMSAVRLSGFQPSAIVSGCCRGVDLLGERWAQSNGLPVVRFPAAWDEQGKSAGWVRNRAMVQHAKAFDGGLILLRHGFSPGSDSVLSCARHARLPVYIYPHCPALADDFSQCRPEKHKTFFSGSCSTNERQYILGLW